MQLVMSAATFLSSRELSSVNGRGWGAGGGGSYRREGVSHDYFTDLRRRLRYLALLAQSRFSYVRIERVRQ